MKNCIDCNIKLTEETCSTHQPKLRCLNCFEIFSNGVEEVLENMIKEMEPSINENKSG